MVIFCTGLGVVLLVGHQRVADLVVGHDALFIIGEDGAFLLAARDDHLEGLLQVGLRHELAALADGAEGAPR